MRLSPQSTPKTTSRSVQPFLHGSRLWPTDIHTDRPRSMCNNRPHLTLCMGARKQVQGSARADIQTNTQIDPAPCVTIDRISRYTWAPANRCKEVHVHPLPRFWVIFFGGGIFIPLPRDYNRAYYRGMVIHAQQKKCWSYSPLGL